MPTTSTNTDPVPRKGNGKTRYSIDDVHRQFREYLGDDYDMQTADATLSCAAANKLDGDPPWLMLISGSGNAKTETVNSVSGVESTIAISTLTSAAALLSSPPKTPRPGTKATGGILRRFGERGILVIKDFTSIISGDRKARNEIMAALREIHDGKWNRNIGADGGLTISWEGRIICICACTTTWDTAHSVIAAMGPRFVIIRSNARDRSGRINAGRRSIKNAGRENAIHEEINQMVAALIADARLSDRDAALRPDEEAKLLDAADLVTLARTEVETDYHGNVVDAHEPEMPTRFAKQLVLIFRGALAIGIGRKSALALVLRCARDSIPPIRLAVLRDLDDNDFDDCRITAIADRLCKPWTTIRRTLDALHVLRIVDRVQSKNLNKGGDMPEDGEDEGTSDRKSVWCYALITGIDLTVLDP
jgi:hypothetical protein